MGEGWRKAAGGVAWVRMVLGKGEGGGAGWDGMGLVWNRAGQDGAGWVG